MLQVLHFLIFWSCVVLFVCAMFLTFGKTARRKPPDSCTSSGVTSLKAKATKRDHRIESKEKVGSEERVGDKDRAESAVQGWLCLAMSVGHDLPCAEHSRDRYAKTTL